MPLPSPLAHSRPRLSRAARSTWPLLLLAAVSAAPGCGSSDTCTDAGCAPPSGECTVDADCTTPPTACDLVPGVCDAGTCTYPGQAPTTTYCLDADADGSCTDACGEFCAASAPAGHRDDCAPGIDCDDSDPGVRAGVGDCCAEAEKITFCEDGDGDGHCTASCVSRCPSAAPAGYRSAAECVSRLDCDDASPSTHPGAQEIACNDVDDDCDGVNPFQCAAGATRPCSVCDEPGTQTCSASCSWEPVCRNVDRWGHWYATDPAILHHFEGPPANGDVCGFPWSDPRASGWCRENAWCIDNSLFSPDGDRNCYAVYGPYHRLVPGTYQVQFDAYYASFGLFGDRVRVRYDVWDGVQRLANLDYDVATPSSTTPSIVTLDFTVAPRADGTPDCRPIEFRAFLVDAKTAEWHRVWLRPTGGGNDFPLPVQ